MGAILTVVRGAMTVVAAPHTFIPLLRSFTDSPTVFSRRKPTKPLNPSKLPCFSPTNAILIWRKGGIQRCINHIECPTEKKNSSKEGKFTFCIFFSYSKITSPKLIINFKKYQICKFFSKFENRCD